MTLLTNRYELLEELGRGAMAVVYKAYDTKIKRTVAIKVLHPEKSTDPELLRRFLQEAKAAGKLAHPHIATIYDVNETEGRPYIAMELLQGPFLDEVMRSDTRLGWAEIIDISMQLASALDIAHSHGVIHRDIKPANIAWSDRREAKITDFGIAHIASAATAYTEVGGILGTPQYMSPEQIIGKPIDARSDLFSLGVVMYQLCTGQKPFGGETVAALTYQIAHQSPESIARLAPDTPRALVDIVTRLMSKEPERRFSSAADLLTALQALQEGRGDKPWRRLRTSLLVGGAALVLIIAAGVLLFRGEPQTERPSSDAQTAESATTVDEERQALQAALNQHIGVFDCARLNAAIGEDHSVSIRGHIQEADMLNLMARVDEFPNLVNVSYEIDTLAWPYCQVASLIQPFKQLNAEQSRGLLFNTTQHLSRFNEGDPIDLALTTPGYPSYVYVDYFRSDGKVVHLYPQKAGHVSSISASTRLRIGGADAPTYIQPPLGDQMILVITSSVRLTERARPMIEPAEEYLTFLYRQLVGAQHEVNADYLMISAFEKE